MRYHDDFDAIEYAAELGVVPEPDELQADDDRLYIDEHEDTREREPEPDEDGDDCDQDEDSDEDSDEVEP